MIINGENATAEIVRIKDNPDYAKIEIKSGYRSLYLKISIEDLVEALFLTEEDLYNKKFSARA